MSLLPTRTSETLPALYKTATISRLTGLSPLVIRAWERRYNLLEPQRAPSGHRMYTSEDLEVLQRARALMQEGLTIGEVAAMGRTALLNRSADSVPQTTAPPVAQRTAVRLATASVETRADTPRNPAQMRAHVMRAAMVLDAGAAWTCIDDGFDALGATRMMTDVVWPALYDLSLLLASGRISAAAENMLSQIVRLRLQQCIVEHPGAHSGNIICACAEEERHELGLLSVAAELAERGVEVLYLGPGLPLADLEVACQLRGPAVVCLSFKTRSSLDSAVAGLEAMARRHPQVVFAIIGDATADVRSLQHNLHILADQPTEAILGWCRQEGGLGSPRKEA